MFDRFTSWIFDLDGTLTVPIYDFPAIKRDLGLPHDRGILEVLAERPEAEAARIHARLEVIEDEHADRAVIAPGAADLIADLHARKRNLGILTRNTRRRALRTLDVIGLRRFFDDHHVLGREDAPHKPDPAGLILLLRRWQVAPCEAVFVGDNAFDVLTGHAAGVFTIHLDDGSTLPEPADRTIAALSELSLPN